VVDDASGSRPFRQGAAGPELDVVRVSADRKCDRRNGEIDGDPAGRGIVRLYGRLAGFVCSHAGNAFAMMG
jgi:hypothetical protein